MEDPPSAAMVVLTVAVRQLCRSLFVLRSMHFEFQPVLGSEERLRELTVTVGQLLERSATGVRECHRALGTNFGHLHYDSVHFSPEVWRRCILMFIHFSDCRTAELQE